MKRKSMYLLTWQKIFLITLLLVVLSVSAITSIILANNHRLNLKREEESGLSEHKFVVSTVWNGIVYERLKTDQYTMETDSIKEIITSLYQDENIGTNGLAIYQENTEVFRTGQTDLSYEKQMIAETTRDYYYSKVMQDGENSFLLVSSKLVIEGETYTFITTRDVSSMYEWYRQSLVSTRILSMSCALIVAIVLLIVVFFLLKPIRHLSVGIKKISQGNYQHRVKLKGHSELSELADNMNLMARAIEKNVHQLEQVADNRKQFIANLAHEMKTPLTSILGFGDILRVKRSVTDEERQEYASIIVEETRRLRTLSSKLMELITLGSTECDFQEIELLDFFEEIGVTLQPMLNHRELQLNMRIGAGKVWVDSELFKSLVYNLVDNAAKVSTSGQEISVNVAIEHDEMILSVQDNGVGIPPKELEKIMEPFYMVDKARTRKAGGAGLGLALCNEIARIHHGTISIASTEGKGTCVTAVFQIISHQKGGGENE